MSWNYRIKTLLEEIGLRCPDTVQGLGGGVEGCRVLHTSGKTGCKGVRVERQILHVAY